MFDAWAAEMTGQAGESGSGHWQLALIFAAIVLLGLFARWRKARMPPQPAARQIRERDTDPNRYRDAADKALVELLETSRELNARMDTKIRVLNSLVRDARDSAEKLETLIAEARALRETGGAPRQPAIPETKPAAEPERRFVSDLHERIYRLKQEGGSIAEIAKATSLSTTEVEFIIKTFG